MPEVPFRREVEPSYPPITRSPSMTSSSISACDTKSVPYFEMVVEIRSMLFPVERRPHSCWSNGHTHVESAYTVPRIKSNPQFYSINDSLARHILHITLTN